VRIPNHHDKPPAPRQLPVGLFQTQFSFFH
jgi:hypothetical protein